MDTIDVLNNIDRAFSVFWRDVLQNPDEKVSDSINLLMIKNLDFLSTNVCQLSYEWTGVIRARTTVENWGIKSGCSVQPELLVVFCGAVRGVSSYPYYNTLEIERILPSVLGAIKGISNLKEVIYGDGKGIADSERKRELLDDAVACLSTGEDFLKNLQVIIRGILSSAKKEPYIIFSNIEELLEANDADQQTLRVTAFNLTHRNEVIQSEKKAQFNPIKQTQLNTKFEDSIVQLPLILNQLTTLSLGEKERYVTAFLLRHYELKQAIVYAQAMIENLYKPSAEAVEGEQKRELQEGYTEDELAVNETALKKAKEDLNKFHLQIPRFANIFCHPSTKNKTFADLEKLFRTEFSKLSELAELFEGLSTKPAVKERALALPSSSAMTSDTKGNIATVVLSGLVATGTIVGSALFPPAAPGLVSVASVVIGGLVYVNKEGVKGISEALGKLSEKDIASGIEQSSAFVGKATDAYNKVTKPVETEVPPAQPARKALPQPAAPPKDVKPQVKAALTDDEEY